MSDIIFKSLNQVSDWEQIVNQIWIDSKQGTFWNTVAMYNFRKLCLIEKLNIKDLSFIIYKDSKPVGFMFFLVYENEFQWTAGYASAPLYWPCFLSEYASNIELIESVFKYIDEICHSNKIEKISLMINATSIEKNIYYHMVKYFHCIDESYASHVISLSDFDATKIRTKYKQNMNRYKNKYKIKGVCFEDLDETMVKHYYNLHVLDSGGKHRSYETYVSQFQTLDNKGFIVCAEDENSDFVGMLQILVAKDEAYEASVAIHPAHALFSVSNMLKLFAIQHLKTSGINIFELGKADYYPTFSSVPSKKNYGINFFKEGWSRGITRNINLATRFFTENALDRYVVEQKKKVLNLVMQSE